MGTVDRVIVHNLQGLRREPSPGNTVVARIVTKPAEFYQGVTYVLDVNRQAGRKSLLFTINSMRSSSRTLHVDIVEEKAESFEV